MIAFENPDYLGNFLGSRYLLSADIFSWRETLVELELYAGVLTRPRHYRFNTRACASNPHCNASIVWEV